MSNEREKFEAWIRTQEGHPFAGQFGNLMWKAWQARASLSAPPVGRVIEVLHAHRVLRVAVDAMLAPLGYYGEISARDDRVQAVMDAMAKIDAEALAEWENKT